MKKRSVSTKQTELKFKPRRRKKEQKLSKEEMAELKALEGKRGDV